MRLLLTMLVVGTLVAGVSVGVAAAQETNAHWYNKQAANGNFSVILNMPDGTEAIVAVAREKGINTTVLGIGSDLTFERKVLTCSPPSCWPPSILLGIDKDMDGKYEADDFAWQWSLASGSPDPTLLHGDTFIQCENVATLTGPDLTFVLVNAYATYFCFSPNITGTAYGALYAPLSSYQLGLGTPDGITPVSTIVALKVLVGGSSSWMNFSGLVDKVTMGNSTRIDEPNNSRSHFEHATSK